MTPSASLIDDDLLREFVIDAAIITADIAERALLSMELGRTRFSQGFSDAAERIDQVAIELGRPDLALRARLVQADIDGRQGNVSSAMRTAQTILAQAQEQHEMYAVARCHFLLAGLKYVLGDLSGARADGVRGVDLLPADAPDGILLEHLVSLAIAYNFDSGSNPYFMRALELAVRSGDSWEQLRIHSNVAYTAWGRRDAQTAVDHTEAMMAVAARHDLPLIAAFRDTAARVYSMVGKYREAIEIMAPIVTCRGAEVTTGDVGDTPVEPYIFAECLVTLAEAYRLRGDLRTAQMLLDRAAVMADEKSLVRSETLILQEQSKLHAAGGDFERAYLAHTRFYDKVIALRTEDEDAQAKAMIASFDIDESREAAARFRELAMRDALTGLYNRRFIDEQLVLLTEQAVSHEISAAIIDVDHFKAVNDDCSHAVGDEVLRVLATILASELRDGDVLGRLGGEEFAWLMPGAGAEEALSSCERLRRRVAAHDWSVLTGEVPVAVSIGVTTARVDRTSPSALLADADRNLYVAKRSGRNRVIADGR